jgi:hypothetical protein
MKNAGISAAIVQDIIFLSGPDQAAFGGLDPAEMGPAILQPFLAGLPSMEQEIDCKLQSNSR